MSAHTTLVLQQAKQNRDLAVEIFCELYIYSHYTEAQVGSDTEAFNYEYSNKKITNSWFNNLMYRLSSIFRRRGVTVELDVEDVKELVQISRTIDSASKFIEIL